MTDVTSYKSDNMTEMWTESLTYSSDSSYPKLVSAFYTGSNDVWPAYPIDFNVDDIRAPYGEQDDWNIASNDWNVYLACGNSGDEGESGRTLNTLMTSGPQSGFEAVTISESGTNDRTVIDDLTVTLTLN